MKIENKKMVYTTIVLHKNEYNKIKELYGSVQVFLMRKLEEELRVEEGVAE